MTDIDKALESAKDAINPHYADAFDDVHRQLATALLALHTRVEAMAAAVAGLADEMEHDVSIVEQHRSARERGGQHVGTGGQLGALPPSGLSAVRRYARDLRAALAANRGAK